MQIHTLIPSIRTILLSYHEMSDGMLPWIDHFINATLVLPRETMEWLFREGVLSKEETNALRYVYDQTTPIPEQYQ
jgi:hypothetical protein